MVTDTKRVIHRILEEGEDRGYREGFGDGDDDGEGYLVLLGLYCTK